MTPRGWLRAGIIALVVAQAVVWFFAGSIWWTFRGGLVWPGQEPSPSRIASDSYVAVAFFVVAAINVAALVPFLVRSGRRSASLLIAIQAMAALAALVFTFIVDTAWILITALAVPALAMLFIALAAKRHDVSTNQS